MSVHHPNVVATHAIDRATVRPFIVSNYMAGGSLQEKLDSDGPLSLDLICRFGVQISRGLDSVHSRGLVHGDIKPSNILLDQPHRIAKICDFGLARVVGGTGTAAQPVVIATPKFASPEQVQGYPIDHRSDLFSTGSVIYAMCTGFPPVPGDDVFAIVRELCDGKARPIQELNPAIPSWLVEIVNKLRARQPNHRFQSARAGVGIGEPRAIMIRRPTIGRLCRSRRSRACVLSFKAIRVHKPRLEFELGRSAGE